MYTDIFNDLHFMLTVYTYNANKYVDIWGTPEDANIKQHLFELKTDVFVLTQGKSK